MYAPQPQPQPAQHWAGHGHPHHAPPQYRQEQPQTQQDNQYAQYQHQHLPSQPLSQQAPPPPPHQLRPDRPEMASVQRHYHPQHQEYRLPPVQTQQFYQPPPMQDYRQHPAPVQAVSQSAPRQRTAIACKYCRRRKIRCSGFDNSEDGRCTNCARFNQECIFTPVSAQTQAFVPAQALYNANNRRAPGAAPPQLYGSYGQPLPPREPYSQQQSGPRQAEYVPQSNGYTLPSPSSTYPPGSHSQYASKYSPNEPTHSGHFAQPEPVQNRRRKHEEPHTPVAPPPNPGYSSEFARREDEHRPSAYHHPAGPPRHGTNEDVISPNSSNPSPIYPSYQQGHHEPLRRTSTNLSTMSSDYPRTSFGSRPSLSPPEQSYYNDNYARHGPPPMMNHSSSNSTASSIHVPMSANEQTPPTPHTPADIGMKPNNPMSISGIVDGGPSRSAADKDMVSALNRPRGL